MLAHAEGLIRGMTQVLRVGSQRAPANCEPGAICGFVKLRDSGMASADSWCLKGHWTWQVGNNHGDNPLRGLIMVSGLVMVITTLLRTMPLQVLRYKNSPRPRPPPPWKRRELRPRSMGSKSMAEHLASGVPPSQCNYNCVHYLCQPPHKAGQEI